MAIVVPLGLLAVAVVIIMAANAWSARKAARAKADRQEVKPKILVHSINDDRCTGCDACVVVCPTDVLELIQNKSRVLRFGDCIQCEQCMWACPTQALVMHFEDREPPPVRVPALDPYYQTGIDGMYLIGEVAGKPLVKNAANVGRAVIEHMRQQGLESAGQDGMVDVVIVGSGPGGLSAALTCVQHGLSYVLLEKDQLIASTVARYPKGKAVMAEPYDVRNVSFLPVYDASKEEMVGLWDDLIQQVGIHVNRGEAVESVQRDRSGAFVVSTTVAQYVGQRVVLATGTRGKPRTLGVPGENLPKVFSLLDDPGMYRGQNVLVVGGGDSAIEAAIALAEAGAKVVLSYRGKSFSRAQPKNRLRVQEMAQQGRVKLLFSSGILGFDEQSVTLKLHDGQQARLANAAAFVLIGADAPIAWLEKLGVEYVERPHWYALGATDQLVESLIGRLEESPRDVDSLARLALGQQPVRHTSQIRPPVPEASVVVPLPRRHLERPAMMPGEVRMDGPMVVPTKEHSAVSSLEDFARGRKAGKGGKDQEKSKNVRKRVAPEQKQEVTRLLRALRDEGARLAHDESSIELRSDLSFVEVSQARRVAGGGAMIGSAEDNLPQIEARPAVIEGLTGVRRMSGIFDGRSSRAGRAEARERDSSSRAERRTREEREEREREIERAREEREAREAREAREVREARSRDRELDRPPASPKRRTPQPEAFERGPRASGIRPKEPVQPKIRDSGDLWSPKKSAVRPPPADLDDDLPNPDADPTRMVAIRPGAGGATPRPQIDRTPASKSKSGATPRRNYPDVRPSFLDEPSPYESVMSSSPRPRTEQPAAQLEEDGADPTNLVRQLPNDDDFSLTPIPELRPRSGKKPLPSLASMRRGDPDGSPGPVHDAETRFTGAAPDDLDDLHASSGEIEELDADELISVDERGGTDHG